MASTELELKFRIPADRLRGLRAALAAACAPAAPERIRLQAHYFDTDDGVLAAARVALRLRKEGRRWVQTLKAEGASRVRRLEHEVELPPSAGAGVPPLDPSRHHGTEAGRALDRALKRAAKADGAGAAPLLVARHGTDVRRTRATVAAGDASTVEIALDEGRLLAGGRSAPVHEVEFELKSGDAAALFALARDWREAHGLWLDTVSKAEGGERLARRLAEAPATKAGTPKVDAGMDAPALLRAVVADCLDQILANASEVASGSFGAEHVHQLRIGIRRLRTALRELGRLAPVPGAAAWEAPLVRAFRALGDWRDRDAAAAAVQPRLRAAGAPAVEWTQSQGAAAPADPAEAVRDGAFQDALLGLLAFTLGADAADAAPARGAVGARAAHRLLAKRLDRLHRRVARDGRRFEKLEEDAQHGVRKKLKRLRYLAESVAPLFGEKAVERYLKHLRPAQDALGAHNDAHVALGLYRRAAERDPKAWFAVGWLEAEQRGASAAACRRALKQAAAAPKFWTGGDG